MVRVTGSQIGAVHVSLNLAHYMLSAVAQRPRRDSKIVVDEHIGQ